MLKTTLDRFISRILFVKPKATSLQSNVEAIENRFRASVIYSAVRCVVQYVVLPFVLPVIGLGVGASTTVSLGISIIAVITILFSLCRFWQIDYAYKWYYLPVAAAAFGLLMIVMALDLQAFLLSIHN